MRIKQVQPSSLEAQKISQAEGKGRAGSFGHSFQRHMSDTGAAEYEAYIQDLTERIKKQGELINEKADITEFQKYRELITQLFNEAASNSYRFCKTDKFDQRGRHKVFAVIRKVNKRLDEVAAMILQQEADQLRMLEAMDDIRGMLVDMLL